METTSCRQSEINLIGDWIKGINVKIILERNNQTYTVDLSSPIDISIPFISDSGVIAFGANPYQARPFTAGTFIGSLDSGSPVNFYDIKINPHGNGTHTESMLHVDKRGLSINETLKNFHFIACLCTAKTIETEEGDRIIDSSCINLDRVYKEKAEALIIRTLPNEKAKETRNYTKQNPPYLSNDLMQEINNTKITHLLLDLPSVDREQDEGKLANHKKFWNTEEFPLNDKTITEMVYVGQELEDGIYLLNLQIISLDIDASPSKPVLYRLEKNEIN